MVKIVLIVRTIKLKMIWLNQDKWVVNFNYESEELLSLDESSSSSEHCEVSSDGETPTFEVDNSIRRSRYPIFRPVAKAENLRFEKDMLFLSPKQFKDVMNDYAVLVGGV